MVECRLHYSGQETTHKILAATPSGELLTVRTFGGDLELSSELDWAANMLILGGNLPTLKRLLSLRQVAGQVRLVYIDPPFATGEEYRAGATRASHVSSSRLDAVAYLDGLKGAPYLEFVRRRLVFLKEVMANDGSIYVHIGNDMAHYVRAVMDEVFGATHFINQITRIKCNPKNFQRRAFGNITDTILFYSKTGDYVWNNSLEGYSKEEVERLFPKVDKDGRRYTTNPLHAPGETANGPTGQAWRGILPPKGRHWRYPPEELERLDREGLIEWSRTGNPRKKIYADEFVKKKKKRQDVWEFKDPAYPSYPTEKNLDMLKAIVQASSNPGDLVLDCFVGAGTTMVAAEQLGRRWIGIDNSPLAIAVSLRRLLQLKRRRPFTLYCTRELLEAVQEVLEQQGSDGWLASAEASK